MKPTILNFNLKIIKTFLCTFFIGIQGLLNAHFIETIYGSMIIEDPVAAEILHSKAMLRLKGINQYGIWAFLKEQPPYTRYDHSLGVYFLSNKFNASPQEAIYGLIHDISHTAFSHVADFMFNTVTSRKAYQDNILSWYAHTTDLHDILEKHDLAYILDDTVIDTFTMIKAPLPHLCIDRLEYNLYGGFIEGWLTKAEIHTILNDLQYVNGVFIFQTAHQAKKFADISVRLSVENWCNPDNCFVYQQMAEMLSYAIQNTIISEKDFHYSDDQSIWKILHASHDPCIQSLIQNIKQYHTQFYISTQDNYEIAVQSKFRGVDPCVSTENGIKNLSELDLVFAKYFDDAKKQCSKTIYLKKIKETY
ncbi:MAG TPA: hypothetical protein VL201_05105 [Patescibacteria group bacterium]|jgi:HD superfamily phosphohydrolase|nr:hypothetical protein [Patescibacteria group bacterium]